MERLPGDVDSSRDGAVAERRTAPPKTLGAGFAWVIVELAPDGILVSDDDGEIVMANRRVEDLFGYDRDALVGLHVENLLPVRSRAVHRVHRARYTEAPRTRPMGAGLELWALRADGTEFPAEISLSVVASDHGPVTVAVIRELQQLPIRHSDVPVLSDESDGDKEHSHDHVITQLFGSGLNIAAVLSRDGLDDEATRRLRDVLDQLDNAIRELRRIMFVSPGALPDGRWPGDTGTPQPA